MFCVLITGGSEGDHKFRYILTLFPAVELLLGILILYCIADHQATLKSVMYIGCSATTYNIESPYLTERFVMGKIHSPIESNQLESCVRIPSRDAAERVWLGRSSPMPQQPQNATVPPGILTQSLFFVPSTNRARQTVCADDLGFERVYGKDYLHDQVACYLSATDLRAIDDGCSR